MYKRIFWCYMSASDLPFDRRGATKILDFLRKHNWSLFFDSSAEAILINTTFSNTVQKLPSFTFSQMAFWSPQMWMSVKIHTCMMDTWDSYVTSRQRFPLYDRAGKMHSFHRGITGLLREFCGLNSPGDRCMWEVRKAWSRHPHRHAPGILEVALFMVLF